LHRAKGAQIQNLPRKRAEISANWWLMRTRSIKSRFVSTDLINTAPAEQNYVACSSFHAPILQMHLEESSDFQRSTTCIPRSKAEMYLQGNILQYGNIIFPHEAPFRQYEIIPPLSECYSSFSSSAQFLTPHRAFLCRRCWICKIRNKMGIIRRFISFFGYLDQKRPLAISENVQNTRLISATQFAAKCVSHWTSMCLLTETGTKYGYVSTWSAGVPNDKRGPSACGAVLNEIRLF